MSEDDRRRWDARYRAQTATPDEVPGPPSPFGAVEHLFPTRGGALDLACGTGHSAVWLALRGMEVRGLDVSPVAVARGSELAARHRVADRCHFDVVDLDDGLPDGRPTDLVLCNRFRDPDLYGSLVERLAPGGMLAVAVLSEVGAEPGRFRARRGELRRVCADLDVLADGEADGVAWIVAVSPDRPRAP